MAQAVADLDLADDVRAALLREGESSLPSDALALVTAYERAEWEVCHAITSRLGAPESAVAAAYLEGVSLGLELSSA